MRTAIHFQSTVKMLHGSHAVCIDNLTIFEGECVAFYGLTDEIAQIITQQITAARSPEQGNLYLFDTESRMMTDSKWFEYIGNFSIYSPHTPFKRNGSVGENIATQIRGRLPSIEEPQLSSMVLNVANLVQLTIADLSQTVSEAGAMVMMKARLARALVFKPGLVLFQEPTHGLSQVVRHKLVELIRRSRRKRKYTALIFTADVRFLQDVADRVLFLNPSTGVVVENQLREWYHNILPFLQPSPSKLLQLARNILQHGGFKKTEVSP